MLIVFAPLALAAFQDAPRSTQTQSPTDIANATKFDLTFDGRRVTGCTVTSTSGYPQVDRYVCDAARSCGDRFSDADRRATCLVRKREELSITIARNLAHLK